MKVKIYQLTNEALKNKQYAFMGYDFAKEHGMDFNKDYECVYTTDLCDVSNYTTYMILDDIFYTFNQKRPEDFKGHSLSVSDVVELVGACWYHKKFYCDKYGWTEMEG